jgi:hypothetical protein
MLIASLYLDVPSEDAEYGTCIICIFLAGSSLINIFFGGSLNHPNCSPECTKQLTQLSHEKKKQAIPRYRDRKVGIFAIFSLFWAFLVVFGHFAVSVARYCLYFFHDSTW